MTELRVTLMAELRVTFNVCVISIDATCRLTVRRYRFVNFPVDVLTFCAYIHDLDVPVCKLMFVTFGCDYVRNIDMSIRVIFGYD